MFQFRVTKYDPAHRDAKGAYTRDEWISVSDIGRTFSGIVLTQHEYNRVEDAYATAALSFMREAEVSSLRVASLENHAGLALHVENGSVLGLTELETVVRSLLRGKFWCRLENADAFIHVGYDYYMYIGVPRLCPGAEVMARLAGLFVETFASPYGERIRG